MPRARATLIVLAAVAAMACTSELHRLPPPLEEMAGGDTDPAGGGEEALAAAHALWSGRPDPGAVLAAAETFLDLAARSATDELKAESLVGAARALAWLAEHESDRDRRRELAERVVHSGQHCTDLAPGRPHCEYWLGIGLGLHAREHPGAALSSLAGMIELMQRVAEGAPELDHGGAHRVLALVFLRAPGWPFGPGDAEAGLAHARRAVELDGEFPPNLLAAAEALERLSRREESREMYSRALEAARALTERGDPDGPEWAREAEKALLGRPGV